MKRALLWILAVMMTASLLACTAGENGRIQHILCDQRKSNLQKRLHKHQSAQQNDPQAIGPKQGMEGNVLRC